MLWKQIAEGGGKAGSRGGFGGDKTERAEKKKKRMKWSECKQKGNKDERSVGSGLVTHKKKVEMERVQSRGGRTEA